MTGLRTRPTAETFALDDLVGYARTGRLRVPSFQRGLRWTRRDVVLLFDSILNGYPIGSLLLWEREAPAEVVTLGHLRIEASAGSALYVVDGQQRVTALASVLTEAEGEATRFAVGYDLDQDVFVPRPSRGSATWVPAHVLYDLSTLLVWFRDRPEMLERFEAAAAVSKTLRDLKLPAYVVRQDDEGELRAIFDRMNNAGHKLTRGEVFAALHRADGAPRDSTLTSVAEDVEERTGFGSLSESLAMKMVLARRGPDVMREIRNEFDAGVKGRDAFAAGETQEAAYALTADAAVRAIEFLQGAAGVPHEALLPYQHLLVALTRFFAHHPRPSVRHEQLLRRFFWRAVVAGPSLARGDTTGVGRLLNRIIVPDDEVRSVVGLVSAVAGPRPAYPPVDPFLTNSAATKALLCAMWDHGPRRLATGERTDVSELRSALLEQHTPAQIVVPMVTGGRADGHDRDAGNRLLLIPDVDRDSNVIEALVTASPDALASHFLELEDLEGLQTGTAAATLLRRAVRLREVQRQFLDRMCEWAQEDTPDLDMLVSAADATDAPA